MFKIFCLCVAVLSCCQLMAIEKPNLMLANVMQKDASINLSHYWVSEKYDGVRAFWDGKQLISRQGNEYHAPAWFIADFPQIPLDGELWLARGQFDRLSGIVRKQQPINQEWRQVRYMVFDMPHHLGTFNQRLLELQSLTLLPAHLVIAPQWHIANEDELLAQLDHFVKNKAEGLMLHDGRSLYSAKRSDDLLKLKPSFDMEAIVTGYTSGKGKYKGMMGAVWVEASLNNNEGKLIKHTFKIGSGFSDDDRQNPPAIGSEITFQYSGLTSTGKPRFARYLRVRQDL
ncbi:MAG: DNA ligase-1 [Oleispira sp.]|jgi:DNA ligase-1